MFQYFSILHTHILKKGRVIFNLGLRLAFVYVCSASHLSITDQAQPGQKNIICD